MYVEIREGEEILAFSLSKSNGSREYKMDDQTNLANTFSSVESCLEALPLPYAD
jgi:hypothetical protein